MAGAAGIVKESFRARFPESGEPRVVRAPGRVNLIGEHTDYNLGYVMPIALDMACYAAWAPSRYDKIRVWSNNLREAREWNLDEVRALDPAHDWGDFVAGVARSILEAGLPLQARDIAIHSTVPVGSGLSSSAALEVAAALALLGDEPVSPLDLVRICHRAENEFVGLPCGVMDQFVSVFGREGAALEIDCRTLQHQPVALPASVEIVAVNTMVKHELGQSAYRERVAECRQAVEAIQARHPLVKSLRDTTIKDLESVERVLTGPVMRRARHVVTEDLRVEEFVKASERGDLRAMGQLFIASHRSLQHDYQVSCEELDFLVDTAIAIDGVYGARMTGGGFGGCTVNLLAPGVFERFRAMVNTAYQSRFGIEPAFYRCRASAGAGEVK